MAAEAAQMLSDWHDFYILIGTAAATLIGLMFVSASIAAGFVTDQHRAGLQAFLTPTVVHFSAILATCLLLLAPLGGRPLLAMLLMAMGLASFVYAAMVWLRMRREGLVARIDNADRVWYGLGPVAFIWCWSPAPRRCSHIRGSASTSRPRRRARCCSSASAMPGISRCGG